MGMCDPDGYKNQQEQMQAKAADPQKGEPARARSELKNLKISTAFFGCGDITLDKLLGKPDQQ